MSVAWLLLLSSALLASAAICHALLKKPDPKAAMGWIAVCALAPILGPILYFLFGINRVVTRARKLAASSPFQATNDSSAVPAHFEIHFDEQPRLAQIGSNVTGRALLSGNQVTALYNGEQAYPQMLEAIANARHCIYMTTYIFNTRRLGQAFIEALTAASLRGLDVRVIIDGLGELTNIPRASTILERRGVRAIRFIPPTLIPPAININLRNHRKILVVDDEIAFTGGMNISASHYALDKNNPKPVTDVHFKLGGPVVRQIRLAFLEDWGFITEERDMPPPICQTRAQGNSLCRAVIDGPNEYFGQMAAVLLSMICAADRRVLIMTPYFLPSQDMLAVLRAAVLRGVQVDVILPGQSDHKMLHWATQRVLGELLSYKVRVHYQPPPFCHSKLFLVDDDYCLVGSANMDPRSLRLNFEFGVEVVCKELAGELWRHAETALAESRPIDPQQLSERPLWQQLRDATIWVCSPYL